MLGQVTSIKAAKSSSKPVGAIVSSAIAAFPNGSQNKPNPTQGVNGRPEVNGFSESPVHPEARPFEIDSNSGPDSATRPESLIKNGPGRLQRTGSGSSTVKPENGLLENLLSLANSGKAMRGSRKRKSDVWSNRSVVLENISRPESSERSTVKSERPEKLEFAESSQSLGLPEPVHSYGDISLLPLLNSVPSENSKIAFKLLEISASYTPGNNT